MNRSGVDSCVFLIFIRIISLQTLTTHEHWVLDTLSRPCHVTLALGVTGASAWAPAAVAPAPPRPAAPPALQMLMDRRKILFSLQDV